MSIAVPLAILAGSIAALMAGIWLVRYFGQQLGWPAEVQRKLVHVAIGLYALTLPLLFKEKWPVLLLILLALALMLFLRTPAIRAGMGAAIHSVERRSAGDIWLALAIGFVFLRAGDSYILYALPIAVIALSDAAAALTGTAYGRRRFAVEDGLKSYEGVVAFFAVTWIVAMVMLLLLTEVPRINVVVLGLTIAGFGATVEAASWRGLDNLFVPICIQFFLIGYIGAPPETLGIIALVFGAAVLAVALLTARLGLSVHVGRAFVIAIFLFLGVGGVHGAVLPVLVMAAHLAARVRRPCCSEHGDLDFIAALCAVGLIWFFVGSTVGPNAINFYNLAVSGMLLGYLILAFGRWWAVPAAVAVFGLYVWLVVISPDYSRWASGLGWLGIGSLVLVWASMTARPVWFDRWRSPRVATLAGTVPMAAYLILSRPI